MKTEPLNPAKSAVIFIDYQPRMVFGAASIEQAKVVPGTALQVLLEYQRDWSRKEMYDKVIETVKEHGGAYGQGVMCSSTVPTKGEFP